MDLSRITVFCFAASYTVALALEAVALVGRSGGRLAGLFSGGRRAVLLGFTAAGFFAHCAYLVVRANSAVTPLSSPAEWCLLAAAVLAAIYLALSLRHARWAVGVFLLPVVLLLIGLAYTASDRPFSPERASLFWGQTHGLLLVAATASVSVGFVSGLMYLTQSRRLKHKTPPASGWSLPSLEWLEAANTRSLSLSVWLMAGGFLSGLVLATHNARPGVSAPLWTDPLVITSSVLLLWLLTAAAFRWAYPPARHGRKVAYLTVTAFGFLAIVLGSLAIVGSAHGLGPPANQSAPDRAV